MYRYVHSGTVDFVRYSLRNHEVDQMILVCFTHSQPPLRDSQDLKYLIT